MNWKKNRLIILSSNRDLNAVAMDRSGFGFDPGRKLEPAEIEGLHLTDPREIRDCRIKASSIFWR